jgi:hypothetical protein
LIKRKTEEEIRKKVPEAYRERYDDFETTFAAEVEKMRICEDTLRRRLLAKGLWKGNRKRRACRIRYVCFEELARFVGSHYNWFERRWGDCCLMMMTGDATGIRYVQFFREDWTLPH